MWNVLANPDLPASQERLEAALIRQLRLEGVRGPLSPEVLLEHSIARFKTPGLRDLGHSDPYLHGGNMDGLEDVVDFYWNTSLLARSNLVRNIAPEIADMHVSIGDRRALVSFLEALDEDYVWPAPGQGRR